MMNIFKNENIVAVTLQLLKKLKVKASESKVAEILKNHPEYPSLLSISDCLTELHIENEAYQLDQKNNGPIDFPFITHFAKEGGSFKLVSAINNGLYTVSDEKGKSQISAVEFFENWEGIVLYAKPNSKSGEKDYFQNRIKGILKALNLPLFIVAMLLGLVILFNLHDFQWQMLLLALLKLTGIAVSMLLLMNMIGTNNPLIRNLCGIAGKNDCNSLLKSKAARLTSWLSWTEIGFFYFTGSFLTLLILPALAPIMAWMNVLALPFTVYSLIYQYRTKNWCVLCCTVQMILMLEGLAFNWNQNSVYLLHTIPFHHLLPGFLLFLFPILIWALLKPVVIKASLLRPVQQQLKKFKNNSDLFKAVLRNQEYHIINEELMPVTFGNPKARTTITVLSNLFCGPCAKAHLQLEEWLEQRDDLQVKILFVNGNHEDGLHTQVALHMMALNLSEDTPVVALALKNWYSQTHKEYEPWAEKYPVLITKAVKKAFAKQKEWSEKATITFTPTIFINGYKLPDLYLLDDIKYLID